MSVQWQESEPEAFNEELGKIAIVEERYPQKLAQTTGK
ncbi:hypothetical protein HBZC1_16850 [Helicobacter bizzozeronii CIII-1]|uniref:Uncharacterized protein n=1 Tax=Helicobacter bizzozeronii (strain CIII-1) TaxID=1002804 RepID=F8KPE7_HELBC|nr:hypothetical protein HBZC1_16850 [Helicobacter bizzozeronii CIII-1]CCF81416.1 hypothetical protein HBZS_118670 [Helicobacter bizzozeronii CCUG 35545]